MNPSPKPRHLPSQEYLGEKWYFITMCCEDRVPAFLNAEQAAWVIEFLRAEAILHRFAVDAYCAMPDHLHLLALGTSPESTLLTFAKRFKQKTAYAYFQKSRGRLWQKNYYDHILRSHEDLGSVAAYIWMNPVRKGLCDDFQTYPFSGSFVRPWKNAPGEISWTPPWKSLQDP